MLTDVVIVGGGPGGAAAGIYLARYGIASVIVEKDDMPRYHIGESMTGEVGVKVRELGLGDFMTESAFPQKFGVNVYNPKGKNHFGVPVMKRTGDGALEGGMTWQVRREDFDKRLLEEAMAQGVGLVRAKATGVIEKDGAVRGVTYRTDDGKDGSIGARVVLDASGLGAFLSTAGVAGKRVRGDYDNQIAIYSQVRGALRDDAQAPDSTQILFRAKNHWAWFIPLDAETVSVGIVTPTDYFKGTGESREDFYRRELYALNPELTRRIPKIDLVDDIRVSANYSYEVKDFIGDGFLCIGDSHRFIDPIFSFGLHFAVHEAEKAAEVIAAHFRSGEPMRADSFEPFRRWSNRGMDRVQELIDAFWNAPLGFSYCVHFQHREDLIDLFAGRVYGEADSEGLKAVKELNRSYREKLADPSLAAE